MTTFCIGADSACDLAIEEMDRLGLLMVPFYVSFGGDIYEKEKVDLGVSAFYQTMVDHPHVFPKSSMPATADFLDAFRPLAKEGTPLLFFCLSSKLSGSFATANTAKTMLLEEFPSWEVEIVDSCCASGQQGLLVLEALRMKDNGLSFQETVTNAQALKETARIFFTTDTLEYLQKGGRIGQVLKMAAVALKIKPIIALREGELFPVSMARSRKKSLENVLQEVKRFFQEADIAQYRFGTGGGYDQEEAALFYEHLLTFLSEKGYTDEVMRFQLGATIGVHTGPHPMGIGFICKYETL